MTHSPCHATRAFRVRATLATAARLVARLPAPQKRNGFARRVWHFQTILFFLAAIPVLAQPDCRLSVSGRVTHLGKEPLPGAALYIIELQKGVVADAAGRYKIGNLCAGSYTLVCQFVGHHTDTMVVMLTQPVRNADFNLSETPETLETVTVQGNRNAAPTLLPQQSLEGAVLQRVSGTSLGEMLKTLPGLNSIQTGPSISKPVIHGLHSNRVLVLNNGIRQEGQQWGSEHAPEIDPFVAKRITVVKGAAGVRYGADAIGGVILIEPDPLPRGGALAGEVNVQGFGNNRQGTAAALLEGGAGKWKHFGWRLQGTYKLAGTARTPDYWLANTQFRERNFSAAAGYQTDKFGVTAFFSRFSTEIGIFRASQTGNIQDFENAIRAERPLVASEFSYQVGKPYQDISHDLLKMQAHYQSGKLGRFSFVFGYQHNLREEYDFLRNSSSTLPAIRFRLNTYTTELLWEHKPIGKSITGTMGVSTIYQGNNVRFGRLIPNFNNLGLGIFATERWAKNRWELEAGLRYDYRHLNVYRSPPGRGDIVIAPAYTYTNLAGTLGAVYEPRQNTTVRLTLSSAWRPPNTAELYSNGVHQGAAAYERGDSTIRTEQAYHATLGLNWTAGKLTAETGVYLNYMPGYIYLKPDTLPVLTIRGVFPQYTYTQVNALFRGIDATATYAFTPQFSWHTKLALVWADNRTAGEYLPFVPAGRLENTLRYERAKWGKLSGIHLAASALNVARQRRALPVSTRTTEILGISRTVFVNDYLPPPPAYMLFNAEAGFSFRIAKRTTDVGLSVQNLTNVRYRDYLNRFRYFSDETGRNVVLRLKFRF